ncbi:hypothetical protein J2Q11_13370 [Tenacibaculum finnmarkense genomovar finnmarkense]|uniref:hypothetical protein n=1 Tax=Tenacibaculum finnmarkense TaxID=2781243 RepID=UPI00187B6B49|nr:hypothetical protein [Tenacibaculum finnmarkense]MBE7635022.1 hypothetical protein [Tenacibaculum finnmarkense genomovar ulcerans]MBE7649191.1 hypothetical protein [Tenacibaculum finnmarkense genomovar ulcerans]MBE7661399.1 hypothetical protein [Tenacibaculum finnmarkense genomovar finnmarkense]MBE7693652.1 hypothetical protein [Tenacibaculum finnmarkense genomovar finnmarkense]MCD8401224.1 hypothetical protein [Tenacibaculum finnmarkense genomovar ulcerans]
MAIIKRASNIKKIVFKNYIIKAKELNKVSDKMTMESSKESFTLAGATKVNVKANNE